MMKYTFSSREKALMVMLAIVLLGIVWYFVVYQPCQESIAKANNQAEDIQIEIDTATVKLSKMQQMQEEIDAAFEAAGGNPTPIPSYDNVQSVMNELNAILIAANTYSINFGSPEIGEDGIVRRGVQLSYTTSTYTQAKQILTSLNESLFRCRIQVFTLTQNTSANGVAINSIVLNKTNGASANTSGAVSVNVSMIYYEIL